MWQRFRKWLNIDHIVDLAVDLFLILFDVLSSPILIVMRLLRWTVGKFMLDGLKGKIKRLIHWTTGKHPLVQIWIWTITVCMVGMILVLMWVFGQAFGEFVTETWGK
jgi:hypothetical protein|tara:strand:- start:66 stop:386 length:321 start_codon:yes stop_codon:yes gene_type:complete